MPPIKVGKFISTITITIGPAGLGLNKLLWKSLWTHISHHSIKLLHQSSSDWNFFVTRTTHKVSKFTFCAKSCHNPSRYGLQITSSHPLDHLLSSQNFTMKERLGSISPLFSPCHLSLNKTCLFVCYSSSHVLTTHDYSAGQGTRK